LVVRQAFLESALGANRFAVRCNSFPMCLDRSEDGVRFGVKAGQGQRGRCGQRQPGAKGGAGGSHASRLNEEAAS
jgi:hypothetical protein